MYLSLRLTRRPFNDKRLVAYTWCIEGVQQAEFAIYPEYRHPATKGDEDVQRLTFSAFDSTGTEGGRFESLMLMYL